MNNFIRAIRVSPPYPEQMGIRRYIKVVNIYDIPAVVIASYILFLFGFLFHFIGFVAPGWYNYKSGSDEIYGGLWKNCSHQDGCYEVLQRDVGGWLEATQTFQTLGFLVLLFTAAVFTRKLARFENKTDATTWLVIGLLFASCFLIMLGFIIFAASAPVIIQKNVDYAFGMVIVADVFLVLSANLFVVDAIK